MKEYSLTVINYKILIIYKINIRQLNVYYLPYAYTFYKFSAKEFILFKTSVYFVKVSQTVPNDTRTRQAGIGPGADVWRLAPNSWNAIKAVKTIELILCSTALRRDRSILFFLFLWCHSPVASYIVWFVVHLRSLITYLSTKRQYSYYVNITHRLMLYC